VKYPSHVIFGFALIVSLSVLGSNIAKAQNTHEPMTVAGDGNACELNAIHLDNLMNMARESGARIFVIAHLGRGETSLYLTHRRLHNARTYLRRFNPEKIVITEGEQVAGLGRVEFYLGSELTLIALVARGGDLCVNCCETEVLGRLYYGWGKKDSRSRQKQLQHLTPQSNNRSQPSQQ